MIKFEVGQIWAEDSIAGISNTFTIIRILGHNKLVVRHLVDKRIANDLTIDRSNFETACKHLNLIGSEPILKTGSSTADGFKTYKPSEPEITYQVAIDRDTFIQLKKGSTFVRAGGWGDVTMQIDEIVGDSVFTIDDNTRDKERTKHSLSKFIGKIEIGEYRYMNPEFDRAVKSQKQEFIDALGSI